MLNQGKMEFCSLDFPSVFPPPEMGHDTAEGGSGRPLVPAIEFELKQMGASYLWTIWVLGPALKKICLVTMIIPFHVVLFIS